MPTAESVQKITRNLRVERIVFYNKESKWGVIATSPKDINEDNSDILNKYGNITVSGNMDGVYEGALIFVEGQIVTHERYGKQISAGFVKVLADDRSKEGIINFLTKSHIKGISTQNAKKIYEEFREDSIETVLHSPYKLINIRGISNKTIEKVVNSVSNYLKHEGFYKYCSSLGIEYSLQNKLLETFGDKALSIIKLDPFKILEVSDDFPFKVIDNIYLENGGSPAGQRRLDIGLIYTLKHLAVLEGSTGCSKRRLDNAFYKLLELDSGEGYFQKTVSVLNELGKVIDDGDIIYLKEYTDIEKYIAEKLSKLENNKVKNKEISEKIIEEEIKDFPFILNEEQEKAVYACLRHKVAVLTSSAGCGKTTITKALYRIYERCGYQVILLSPTAKACRRLEECTGGVAQTIHKFLGMTKDSSEGDYFEYSPNTVIIVDEASMLDIILCKNLVANATSTTKFLLVGDNNQLPSVQAGNVLGDLIDSKKIHVSLLTDVVRQAENSNIIKYCTMINKGEVIDVCEHDDFIYEEFGTAEDLRDKFIPLYLEEVKNNGLNEVQVITPYKKGELGMNTLNIQLQSRYNSNPTIDGFEPYRIGDRVRHTKNNYKKEVYNGETGIIKEVREDSSDEDENILVVDYGNKEIEYNKDDINELTLSYTSTVHASQGSEYKVVFVILDDTSVNDFLHIRRLLYTAVSRGKKKVYIFTKPYLVDRCILNDSYRPRITKLKDYLRGN